MLKDLCVPTSILRIGESLRTSNYDWTSISLLKFFPNGCEEPINVIEDAYNFAAELICVSSIRIDEVKNNFKIAKNNSYSDGANEIQKTV